MVGVNVLHAESDSCKVIRCHKARNAHPLHADMGLKLPTVINEQLRL